MSQLLLGFFDKSYFFYAVKYFHILKDNSAKYLYFHIFDAEDINTADVIYQL